MKSESLTTLALARRSNTSKENNSPRKRVEASLKRSATTTSYAEKLAEITQKFQLIARDVDHANRWYKNTPITCHNCSTHIHRSRSKHPVSSALADAKTNTNKLQTELISLRKQVARHQAFFMQAADGFFIIDPRTKYILDVNHAGAKRLDYNRSELLQLSIMDITAPGWQANFEIAWRRIIKDGEYTFQHAYQKKNGALLEVEICSRLININGKQNIVQRVMRDIDERKILNEERLKKAKLESIGNLAGGIAHDFNNILTVIIGNISLARTFIDRRERALEKLGEAEKATDHAKKLTRQLLTFSQGGTPIRKPTKLPELIEEAAHFALIGSSIKCRYDFAKDLPLVEVDAGQIEQVIHNLVLNAERATGDGGEVKISIATKRILKKDTLPLPAGKYIYLKVADHGHGISTEHLHKIFDPYFTTAKGGHGLGLATAYSIIKQHDGYITVRSRPDKGTTFYIYLPTSSRISKELKNSKLTSERSRGHVLIMDDDTDIRALAAEALISAGYTITEATDGTDAIRKYIEAQNAKNPVDMVIMDLIVAGGMGGRNAIIELIKLDPKVKALVSSGYSNDPVMANYKRYGFKGVVAKPYELSDLITIVNSFIPKKPLLA